MCRGVGGDRTGAGTFDLIQYFSNPGRGWRGADQWRGWVLYEKWFWSWVGCPPKLVSYRNNRNWNRNLCRHYPKQDVCFGCFALISKQGVSVFWNSRNKQETNRNNSTFVKISIFLIAHTISSVCFCSFDTSPKHRNKPKNFFGFREKANRKTTETDWVSVCFGSNQEKNLPVSRTPKFIWDFFGLFRFVSRKFCLFRLFRYRSETPKQTEKNVFGFAKQTEKQPKQIEFRFVSVRT